jgi:hypothetical protein
MIGVCVFKMSWTFSGQKAPGIANNLLTSLPAEHRLSLSSAIMDYWRSSPTPPKPADLFQAGTEGG